MNKRAGFTLIELLVGIAIVGILAATAIPLYRTYQQRAYGSEATLMIKRLLDAQIIYYLENEDFFPENGQTKMVFHDDSPNKGDIKRIRDALNITIPVDHFLDYTITNAAGICLIDIRAQFSLFKSGENFITATMDNLGNITFL